MQQGEIKVYPYLKSNMDRFIGTRLLRYTDLLFYLKSNMDRFIVVYNVNFLKFSHI